MRGSVARDFRRQASKVANQTVEAVRPAIKAALGNEELTRGRVEKLEFRADDMDRLVQRGLLGRLRWLLTGK